MHKNGYRTIEFAQNQSLVNTRNQNNLRVVRCRLELTKQRIEYMGVQNYNLLPLEIRQHVRISQFKTDLKNHLLRNLETFLM